MGGSPTSTAPTPSHTTATAHPTAIHATTIMSHPVTTASHPTTTVSHPTTTTTHPTNTVSHPATTAPKPPTTATHPTTSAIHPVTQPTIFAPKPTTPTVTQTGSKIDSMLKSAEGVGKNGLGCKYNDSRGIPTTCWGYNLRNSNAASSISSVGGNFSGVMNGTSCLSQPQCQSLFDQEVNHAKAGQSQLFGTSLDHC